MTIPGTGVRLYGIVVFFFILLHCVAMPELQAGQVFLDEQFSSLDRWQPFYFPKIENHSSYSTGSLNGTSCLIAKSSDSASAIILKTQFNVYEFPDIIWRWRISNVYAKGDSSKKEGDDYPVRLYVMFNYDPDKASLVKKIRYETAKLFYGKYPPHSSLNYIWANNKQTQRFIPNPYSELTMMVPVAAGSEEVGRWLTHRVNIVRDYRAAFGEAPPAVASVAIMSDADDTGESARAYVDYIRIGKGQ